MKYIFDGFSNKVSKLITNEYSTSFSFSTRLLSKNIRQSIYSIYGLVRLADEIVDSFHEYDKKVLLKRFKNDFDHSINDKISLNPILNSFQFVYHKYNFTPELVQSFFRSMEMDLEPADYDENLYNDYIYGSAEVVGLMCLKVFVKGDEKLYDELKYSAMKLGSAFQKVNFLRDMEYDNAQLGRTYFPNIDFDTITNQQKNEIITDIEKHFDVAILGLMKLDKDSFFGVYVAYRYYRELMQKIKKINMSRLRKERIRVSNFRKFSLILNSRIKIALGLF